MVPTSRFSFLKYTLLSLCIAGHGALHTDALDMLLDDDQATFDFLEDQGHQFKQGNPADPQTIASILVDLGIVDILQQDLYLHTNELNNRSLLDYPIYLPHRWKNRQTTIGLDWFWNKTDRMFFTRKSGAIGSYLNLTGTTMLQALTTSFEKLKSLGLEPDSPFEPARILPLLRNFTIEQRRVGALFHAEKRYQKLFLYALCPVYYLERNLFATEDEQVALEDAFGKTDQAAAMDFAEKHLISDAFGIGDTRLSIDFQIIDKPIWGLNLGFFTTLPTAFAFKNGLKGSHFKKNPCQPKLSFTDIFSNFTCPDKAAKEQTIQDLKNIALGSLDEFSAITLDSDLGNNGHVGLGFAVQTDTHLRDMIKRNWAEHVDFRSRLSLEYLFSSKEKRCYIEKSDCEKFEALGLNRATSIIVDQIENDETYAKEVLRFLEIQAIEKLFPFVITTRVHPGFIFRWTSRIFHEGERWYVALGNDMWVQGKEKLTDLELPQNFSTVLDIQKAQKPIAYQNKAYGILGYKVRRENTDWILSLSIDQSYYNYGIGKDYTVSFGFEAHY